MQELFDAAVAAQRAGNWRDLERIARELIARGEPDGDARGLALGYNYLGLSYFLRNDGRGARAAYERSLEFATQVSDQAGILRVVMGLANIAGDIDVDAERLHALSQEALGIARDLGDEKSQAVALGNIAEACRLLSEYDEAIRCASEAAAIFLRIERWSSAGAQYATIGHVQLLRRDFAAAFEAMQSAWVWMAPEPVPLHRAWYFQVWFLIAATLQQWETAARIYGFVARYRDEHNTPRLQSMLPVLSEFVERLYKVLGYDRAMALEAEGEAYTIEEAQALAEQLRLS